MECIDVESARCERQIARKRKGGGQPTCRTLTVAAHSRQGGTGGPRRLSALMYVLLFVLVLSFLLKWRTYPVPHPRTTALQGKCCPQCALTMTNHVPPLCVCADHDNTC